MSGSPLFPTIPRQEDDPDDLSPQDLITTHVQVGSSSNTVNNDMPRPDASPSITNSSSTPDAQMPDQQLEALSGSVLPTLKAQIHPISMPIDLRMLDYVDQCNENLICPICRCPFVDPVILSECDHYFCRECIHQTWLSTPHNSYGPSSHRRNCPSCRTPAKSGLSSSTNKILTNILDDLLVKCPNMPDGCTAQIKRGEVQDHVALYCGYTIVECSANGCKLFSMRKDSLKGCLHATVCCLGCKETMYASDLGAHWHDKCPDRKLICQLCSAETSCQNLNQHREQSCPGSSVSCPGKDLGCPHREVRAEMALHAKSCPLALLQPTFATQKHRLDEQEIAQKQMSRKMEIMENGLSTMRDILYPPTITEEAGMTSSAGFPFQMPAGFPSSGWETSASFSGFSGHQRSQTSVSGSGDDRAHLPLEIDSRAPIPHTNADGPYTSPLHHLLSMHENLREEMSRISNALQEQEGRQSLQILNENIRTREEMSYLGAQIAGLTRQVHWLTSTHLQRQGSSGTPGAGNSGDMGAAGSSVEAAVSAVNTAVRGAARIVTAGREGMGLRRGSSEEGRTKL